MSEVIVTIPFMRLPLGWRIFVYIAIVLAATIIYLLISHFLIPQPFGETADSWALLWLGLTQLGLMLIATATIRRWLLGLPVVIALGIPLKTSRIAKILPWLGMGLVLGSLAAFLIWVTNSAIWGSGMIGWGILLEILVLAVFALFEEMAFRGVLWGWLAQKWGGWFALFITTVLFALFHTNSYLGSGFGLINVFLSGILLGLLRMHSGDIWLAWGWHWGWNTALAVGVGDRLSGVLHFPEQFLQITLKGEDYLSGGSFGIEGSLVTSLALILFCLVMVFADKKRLFGINQSDNTPLSVN